MKTQNTLLAAWVSCLPPGTHDGVVFANFSNPFANSNQTLILNAAGQMAFAGQLTGSGITGSNGYGIWATDRSGALQLIARWGDPLEVAPGDFRTVSYLAFLADPNTISTGNSDGRPSAFNNLGQLAFSARFTDGSYGVFVSNRVAIPEPSTFILGAAAFGLCITRRRHRAQIFSCRSADRSGSVCHFRLKRREILRVSLNGPFTDIA